MSNTPSKPAPLLRPLDQHTGVPVPNSTLVVKGNTDVAIKIKPPDKQWLEGKLTKISAVLATVGTLAKAFGWDLPTAEIDGAFTWLLANWDSLMQFVGMLGVIWGQLRHLWRKPTEIEVIKR